MANVKAKGLAKVQVRLIDQEGASIILTDVSKKNTGFLIGPEGLEALLEALLPLLHTWSQHPELNKERISGSRQSIPATRIVIQDGRNTNEAAAFVEIGSASLVFLVPKGKVSTTFVIRSHSAAPGAGQPIH